MYGAALVYVISRYTRVFDGFHDTWFAWLLVVFNSASSSAGAGIARTFDVRLRDLEVESARHSVLKLSEKFGLEDATD